MMGIFSGKTGLVRGVANDRSYASYISKAIIEEQGRCLFTYLPIGNGKMENRVRQAIGEMGVNEPWLEPCDASNDQHLDELFARVVELLQQENAENIVLFCGGTIPDKDIPHLQSLGFRRVFTPGTPLAEILGALEAELAGKR